MWVGYDGEVHLDLVYPGMDVCRIPGCKFRYEVWIQGNGYTGPEAGKQETWLHDLFEQLIVDWEDGRNDLIDHREPPSDKARKRLASSRETKPANMAGSLYRPFTSVPTTVIFDFKVNAVWLQQPLTVGVPFPQSNFMQS